MKNKIPEFKRFKIFIFILGMMRFIFSTSSLFASSASLLPAQLPTGSISMTTMTLTLGASDFYAPGSKIILRVPDGWEQPDSALSPTSPGYAGFQYLPQLSFQTTGQYIVLTVTSPGLTYPSSVSIYYTAQPPCTTLSTARFQVFIKPSVSLPPSNFADIDVGLTVGNPSQIRFKNYLSYAKADVITPIFILATDNCGNEVPLNNSVSVNLYSHKSDFNSETLGILSLDGTNFSLPFSSSTLFLASGNSGTTVYYRINSGAQFEDTKYLEIQYQDPNQPTFNISQWTAVSNLTSGIINTSVDTGVLSTSQKSVSFSPDRDGVDDNFYINFTLPSEFYWQVDISTNQQFSTITRTLYGFGKNNRVAWDGFTDWSPNAPPDIAKPGQYYIRISLYGGQLSDTSLSGTLSANGMHGYINDGSGFAVANANIDIQGPTPRYVRSAPDGTFQVFGLIAGSYSVRINKTGFAFKEVQNVSVTNGADVAVSTITLDQASVVRVIATRTCATTVDCQEIWGGVNANSTDWKYQSYGTIHFASGSTVSDAGDYYNGTPSTYTALSLIPSIVYTLHFNIASYGVSDSTISLAVNQTQDLNVSLTRRANISGYIVLPQIESTGLWVSVEAKVKGGDDRNPNNHHFGGVFINAGSSSGTYFIFGVPDATYVLSTQTQGYARASTETIVMNSQDAINVDFPVLDQGSVIVGTITVQGDTSDLSTAQNGFIQVPINSWSQSTFSGSYKEIYVATDTVQASSTFTLTGLTPNVVYDVYVYLPGFESVPPGPKRVTVTGASTGLNLTFKKYSGALTGTVTLPGAQTDYSTVQIELQSFNSNSGSSNPQTNLNGSGQFSFSGLGTDFYTLRAFYPRTGFVVEKGIQVVNGSTSTVTLDLTGNTYSISGKVNTTASSPFNSLSYVVNQSTNTTLYANGISSSVAANRIVATKVNGRDYSGNSGGSSFSGSGQSYDPKSTFFGFYDADKGTYSITNLSPGLYSLANNDELNGDTSKGSEIAKITQLIRVVDQNVTGQNFTLTDGFNVSGNVRVESGISEDGRNFRISLKNSKGTEIASTDLYLTGTTKSFSLQHIPSGSYSLTATEIDYPNKYSSKQVTVDVGQADKTNQEIVLLKAAKFQGQFRVKTSGELISSRNFDKILPDNFSIEARSNPWFPSGFGFSYGSAIIGSDDRFSMTLNPGTYDIIFKTSGFIGQDAVAQGKKQFVSVTLSGIELTAGQTKDLGIVELIEGISIKGTITDKSGNVLPNVIVRAAPSGMPNTDPLEATTNESGQYVLQGVDSFKQRYYDIIAAPRPEINDNRFNFGFSGATYGEVRKTQVDTQKNTVVDFKLEQALGSISGVIVSSPTGGILISPFDNADEPGAELILNKQGNTPIKNPLGDIEAKANADGTFSVKGLVPGIYDLWVLVKNYSNAIIEGISVGNGNIDVGTATVKSGFKLSGTITKSDQSLLSYNDYQDILAIRNGFEDIIIGKLTIDAANNITGYSITGFQPSKRYDVILINHDSDITVLSSSVTLTSDEVRPFIFNESTPTILSQSRKNNGVIQIQFDFTRALRNSSIDLDGNGLADDSEASKIISTKTASGVLSAAADWLSSDRKRAVVTYTPASGETSFSLTVNATFITKEASSGLNQSRSQAFTFYSGIGNQKSTRVLNANGGRVQLENDTTEFSAQAGTFGDDSGLEISVGLRAADSSSSLPVSASAQNRTVSQRIFSSAKTLGIKAFPEEMGRAISKAQATSVDTFSSFYDIFLPQGVSHSFPEGKEAKICLSFDTNTVTDPTSLNVYYYNTQTSEYLLENQNRSVDTDNNRICANISHASVFTLLASSQSIVTGAGYTGELSVMNYPNPFNLKSKSVTLLNATPNQQTINGTMIKFSVPTSMSGSVEIQIFNVLGEKVRTLNASASAGTFNYLEWDGTNDHGEKVASGSYIGRFTIAGGNERFFKMAVLK